MINKKSNVAIDIQTYLELKEYCKLNGLKINYITTSIIKNYLEEVKK